jgi:hypothetical protein
MWWSSSLADRARLLCSSYSQDPGTTLIFHVPLVNLHLEGKCGELEHAPSPLLQRLIPPFASRHNFGLDTYPAMPRPFEGPQRKLEPLTLLFVVNQCGAEPCWAQCIDAGRSAEQGYDAMAGSHTDWRAKLLMYWVVGGL